jgi:hypothetical protein
MENHKTREDSESQTEIINRDVMAIATMISSPFFFLSDSIGRQQSVALNFLWSCQPVAATRLTPIRPSICLVTIILFISLFANSQETKT